MSRHVEMITDYIVVGEDYQYCDNHGLLIRCGKCKFSEPTKGIDGTAGDIPLVRCRLCKGFKHEDDFCKRGEPKGDDLDARF